MAPTMYFRRRLPRGLGVRLRCSANSLRCVGRWLRRLVLYRELCLQLLDPGGRLLSRAHSLAAAEAERCDGLLKLLHLCPQLILADFRCRRGGSWHTSGCGGLCDGRPSLCRRSWHVEPRLILSPHGLERAVDDVLDGLPGLVGAVLQPTVHRHAGPVDQRHRRF